MGASMQTSKSNGLLCLRYFLDSVAGLVKCVCTFSVLVGWQKYGGEVMIIVINDQ